MKTRPLPPLKYLNECFELSEDSPTGLIWKIRPRWHFPTLRGQRRTNAEFAGKPAGSITETGKGKQYFRLVVSKNSYYVHRIVFSIYHNTELPTEIQIDHEDSNGLNNKISNLRLSTAGENQHNVRLQKNNTSKHKCVFYRKDSAAWFGIVQHRGKRYRTGYSPSKQVIIEMVRELREKLHGEFTNHG